MGEEEAWRRLGSARRGGGGGGQARREEEARLGERRRRRSGSGMAITESAGRGWHGERQHGEEVVGLGHDQSGGSGARSARRRRRRPTSGGADAGRKRWWWRQHGPGVAEAARRLALGCSGHRVYMAAPDLSDMLARWLFVYMLCIFLSLIRLLATSLLFPLIMSSSTSVAWMNLYVELAHGIRVELMLQILNLHLIGVQPANEHLLQAVNCTILP